ncbi:hypothetical protein BKA67DRAFT_582105 [Truncatella angustata]|uniref:Uncharacterized protein n=1 Tax=Truncatella angustata TaxID=152316 RepID=A0A9P8RJK4_9PEZI|nr:uncharacterized protein BKA67DRAFT_582105 [Truncatella angustata]KAH6647244.1 hypothetical protein BKA67DRAFT_582105 [Truncatella angustata]
MICTRGLNGFVDVLVVIYREPEQHQHPEPVRSPVVPHPGVRSVDDSPRGSGPSKRALPGHLPAAPGRVGMQLKTVVAVLRYLAIMRTIVFYRPGT